MRWMKKTIAGSGTIILSLFAVTACANTSGSSHSTSNSGGSHNETSSIGSNTISENSSGKGTKAESKTFVLHLDSEAKSGKTDNSLYTAGNSSITQVKQRWGSPDKQGVAGQGTYATYKSEKASFGFNQDGTIFDVRSYSKQVQSLTLSDVRAVLGNPKETTKPTASQINEIYQVNNTFQLEFIINTGTDAVNHISVFDASAVHSPGTQPTSPHGSNIAIRGVIEGFYGKPWSNKERINMFSFMQKENLNTYVYAPKGDPYQRVDWREPYPSVKLQQMKALVAQAKQDGVQFVYSISPGMTGYSTKDIQKSITYSSASDRKALEAKIHQLQSIGVNTFMLSFDDIEKTLKPADKKVYGTDYAKAQMQLANQVLAYEKARDPNFRLWFVPTFYYGMTDGPYWQTLRSTLNHSIKVIWTGKWVLNKSINSSQAKAITNLYGRKPILWDNYPVNDYTYDKGKQHQLMLGPLEGRTADLTKNIAGYISNPMVQPYASKVALETISDYLQNPGSYQPKTAWNGAINHLSGITNPTLFKTFAEFNTVSTLNSTGYSPIGAMVAAYRNASTSAQKQSAEQGLETEFRRLRNLPSTLPPTITNKELLHEIQPWLTKLGAEGQGGLDALAVINDPSTSNKNRLAKELKLVSDSPYQVGGEMIAFMKQAGNQ
ncbi:beta-N-acetylglucosaminidase domain-containing protein [Alicyclobacillus sp. SO9]|uniref:beta-N-acetylglucosaminidase domain-containing protein n=1 Tax=Alicyclobacillus sp. SO9 TaxID=2665646 RepID=UPI0018E70DE7|nr:beta-N-acetylglucosaminidase domain-containing protein [Alicyclobacillus sp. SO9]QQE80035.1 beta-N-acetylglucosaminidase domain-containing protein [Alicyclobacillus sp. SO9]